MHCSGPGHSYVMLALVKMHRFKRNKTLHQAIVAIRQAAVYISKGTCKT